MHTELSLIEQVKTGKIWDFHGGVHPVQRKEMSNQSPIARLDSSSKLYITIKQHIGNGGAILVKAGDEVKKGQPLTLATVGLSLPVHAPTSGRIVEITDHVAAHPSGMTEPTIVIEPDGKEQWGVKPAFENWKLASNLELVAHLQNMGISGLGGAGFPTYIKVSQAKPIELLIINAVECEPYITADDVLMREHAEQICSGAEILKSLVNSQLCVIAIEDNKPEAILAMQQAANKFLNIEIRVVPTKYPSGGEKQLIQLITGQQVPSGKLPADIGVLMQNVGTAYAVKRAVVDGEPLIERVVTVTGESISEPQNIWVKIGIPVTELLKFTGFQPEQGQRIIMGGPMMGFNIMNEMMPVVKSTNCILAPREYYLPARGNEQACIRCGQCADVCPAQLLPQQLVWYAKANDQDKLKEYNLFDCIECGACSYVCPSQIPLVQYYRKSKAEIRHTEADKQKSEKAKIRFEQRQLRLEREKEERLQKHKEAAERRKQALDKDTSAKDKIAAALARAKAKKQAVDDAEPTADTEKQNSPAVTEVDPKDKVAAAIARAKAKKLAQQETTEPPAPSEPSSTSSDDKKDKVAAAIARAKAKKAAQQTEPLVEPEQTSADDERQAKIAAAIAKAKAKKHVKEHAPQTDAETQSNSPSDDADAERKAKVAAAIARAKAKKKAQQDVADEGETNKQEKGNPES